MCQKVNFKSKRIALRVAHKMKCNGKVPASKSLRSYFCNQCNAWHLTSWDLQQYRKKYNI